MLTEFNGDETRLKSIASLALGSSDKEILDLNVGMEDGYFASYHTQNKSTGTLDPRTRDWYNEAKKAGKMVFTEPYVDKNTGKLYWNGFVNNGMGYNEWGSYGPLSDKDWKANGKYDTALYEVDINTGAATLIDKITYRITYSCMWVEGGDATEGVNQGESITIADNGMCTYCSTNDLDFSGLTAFQAYIATSYNTATQTITVQHVNEAKAGTGLFLKGIPGTYKVPYCTSYEYALNMLKGVTETKQVEPTEGEYSNFILNPSRTDSSSPYFIRLESATDIAANSAYLQIPTSILNGNANIVGISFEEGVTGINSIASDTREDAYYSLTGVRVTNPTKGVYIHKGKKVVVED